MTCLNLARIWPGKAKNIYYRRWKKYYPPFTTLLSNTNTSKSRPVTSTDPLESFHGLVHDELAQLGTLTIMNCIRVVGIRHAHVST